MNVEWIVRGEDRELRAFLSGFPQHFPGLDAVFLLGNGIGRKDDAVPRLLIAADRDWLILEPRFIAQLAAGIEAVRETIRAASDSGVEFLTIYSFSTENWKRPDEEVEGLMNLFAKTMLAEVDGLHEEHVRVMTIGDISRLPKETRDAFDDAWNKTKDNDGMTLLVAVNYGSRQEILHAVQQIVDEARETGVAPQIDEALFERGLYTAGIPDPELLIRTSGEMRISNFLLWQLAYTEIYVTDVLWPDFNRYEFLRALLDYQGRDRRFGAV